MNRAAVSVTKCYTSIISFNYSIYNQLLLNNLQVISQKYGRNL